MEPPDVVLHAAWAAALASEHEPLTAVLAAHFTGNLRDLQEAGDRSDVTYLANKTGWDARAVALASLADQFSERTQGKVPAPFFYALFRAGLPANEDVLYHADGKALAAIWTQAIEQGVIPPAA